ncbi:chitooligosaccharidolytic beta-N-acetylglucosaminidase [Anastrepha ludens]|uniref:chitooligosaccharidolytic beta-N-acetylglucosaminidase n=1 Tax=Anastrepha ludens TaxID=28586 RepID=UPI0023B1E5C3|nr:chitooligosaccharidolytic beta-N-acetylglucosaminidase [Anastrepha ludens]XP_053950430.1 chitooligosaccharidolytic beta-N-acetylglucosaminidase [Anastrepha ludens]XP_053950431.1 chitooligosaccharidolytic beta-N-acetylglucosaminidase [Anastrepha ludens]XP_053950432.1 chitooligosaccharidolytic beta-N-acetylglucosaminidase [Anastrepha ludens]XP_053950433.1 chitooligosaccharidolytic beta-N-acetylglucosaminidase [Anastrepha ludens]XP_053950434.1 chitooligosaccharidolytic beta-N-acetylglucosamini
MSISSEFSLLAVALLVFAATAQAENGSPQWICTSTELCHIDKAANIGDAPRFESQNDCRLSCGSYGAIWPLPTDVCTLSDERIRFDPWKVRFNVVAPDAASMQYVRESNRIFVSNILKECVRNCSLPNSKEVLVKTTVSTNNLVLDWSTNETYALSVRTREMATFVEVKARTVYGARHALETLSNLITGSKDNGLLMVKNADVRDGPVFSHRGLLLDTARNFIPLRMISRTLDAMAASKMNVLHWHVVDTQSFPLEITRVPELQQFGAYEPDMVYSRADTHNMVRYARLRGIRIIIEIDGPSHAGNGWQWGPLSGLGHMAVCVNQQPWRSYCIEPPCGQLNPLNENMYGIMKEIYEDLAEVNAPEETIHMGGDEVFIPCWNSTTEITRRMRDMGFDLSYSSFYKLWSEFHQKNLDSWDNVTQRQYPRIAVPKSVILWSSHLTDPDIIVDHLPKERYIIQTWVESDKTLNKGLVKKGYRIIVSTKNAWYLDHGFWGYTSYYNWKKVYDNRMEVHPLVLGGEVCMWSEFVDQNSVESRIWPRAGAAAERLWANPEHSSVLVQSRFLRYRERLLSRGIKADAVIPKWCVLNEGQCL